MAYTPIETITTSPNLTTLLTYPNLNTPTFYPIILFALFIILTSISFFREVSREGNGDIYSSLAVSSFIISLIATAMNLIGMVGTTTLVIIIVGTGFILGIFMFTKKN